MSNEVAVRNETGNTMMSLQTIEKMANYIFASKILGKDATMEQTVAIMLVAQAENRHPVSAAQDYWIIQGRPALKAQTILARFQDAGGTVKWHELSDTNADATFSHPQGGELRIAWDIDRAKKAGYYDRNPKYKTEPRTQLRCRTISEGVKAVYPRVLSGMAPEVDVEDILYTEPRPLQAPDAPLQPAPAVRETTATVTDTTPEPAPKTRTRRAPAAAAPEPAAAAPEPAAAAAPEIAPPDGQSAADLAFDIDL